MLPLPKYAVLDGGLATELVRQGHEDLDNDPLWSSRLLTTDIAAVNQVHKSFLSAGADIIETNTYQASIRGFQEHLGLNEVEAADLIKEGVACAREACREFTEEKRFVAGSLGPYGACQHDGSEYTGSYVDHMTVTDLCDWHRPQVTAFVEAGVDILAFDTIPAQKEAEGITSLLAEFPDQKAWISFSCRDGSHTVHGEKLADAVSCVRACPQVIGVGINCTHPDHVTMLLTQIKDVVGEKTVIVYPNSGEAWTPEKKWHGRDACRTLAEFVPKWMSLGAHWIGGCCRSTPDDIRAIKIAMDRFLEDAC